MTIILYSTEGCHLCEQVQAMWIYAKQNRQIEPSVELVVKDIIEDETLVKRFGESIPVLHHGDDYFYWPFEYNDFLNWVDSRV